MQARGSSVSTDSHFYSDSCPSCLAEVYRLSLYGAHAARTLLTLARSTPPNTFHVCIRMLDKDRCSHCPVGPFSQTIHRNFVSLVTVCFGLDEHPWFPHMAKGHPFIHPSVFGTCRCVRSGGFGRTFSRPNLSWILVCFHTVSKTTMVLPSMLTQK